MNERDDSSGDRPQKPEDSRERPSRKLKDLDVKTVRIGLAALIGVAVLVVLGITLADGGDDSCGAEVPGNGQPVSLSRGELSCNADKLGHLAYWVGPRPPAGSYEVTSSPDGRVFVRYLTGGAEAGDKRPDFLTVGTYSLTDAVGALERAQSADASKKLTREDGYTLLSGGGLSAYVVFDDEPDLQIEVYSPKRGEALRLASTGALEPLG